MNLTKRITRVIINIVSSCNISNINRDIRQYSNNSIRTQINFIINTNFTINTRNTINIGDNSNRKYYKILSIFCTLTFVILFLSSCGFFVDDAFTMPKSWNWGYKPRPYLARGFPDGEDDFSQGFRAGCIMSLGSIASGGVRTAFPIKIDGYKIANNKIYAIGFNDGYEHCAYFYDWDIT